MLNPFRFTEFNAKVHASRMALEDDGAVTTWTQFHALAKRIAEKLSRLGVKPGDLVATCLPSGLDWLFTNALFHEACISCSNHGYAPLDPGLGVRWIITNRQQPHFPEAQVIYVDRNWFADTMPEAATRRPVEYADTDALCRLVLTSGTTGHARGAAYTVGMLETRLRAIMAYWVVPGGELNLMGLSTIGGFMTAMGAAFAGGSYFANPGAGAGIVQTLRKYELRGLTGAPVQLARLMQHVSEPLPALREIRSAGGLLSPALVTTLRRSGNVEIFNVYGSTEVGGIAMCPVIEGYDPAVAGVLLDGVEVEVADKEGRPLPPNTRGIVRVRTPSMVRGYHQHAGATAEAFRDGWFHPGDRGMLLANGMLLLTGRNGEIINRGGVKIDPAQVDGFLLAQPGIEDGAAFGLLDPSGVEEFAVVVRAPDSVSLEELRNAFYREFGDARTPKYYFRMESVPRNQMGKVLRARLSQHFSQVLRGQAVEAAAST